MLNNYLAIPLGVIAIATAIYLGILSAYILLITIGSWLYRPAKSTSDTPPLKVAIIVPAHNESEGIGRTMADLLALDYPRELFDVFVVADNCTDDTAEKAARCGAIAKVRHDLTNRGKGQALDWFLRESRDDLLNYDLVAFVDADMRLDKGFLRAIASAFSSQDCSVVQSRYTADSNVETWRAAVAFASFAYVNHVRPAGRCFWGSVSRLNGSGMVFRRDLILETGWPVHSIAEDVEFGQELTLRGIRVLYEPRAAVTSEMPSTFKQIAVQQARWEGGKLFVLNRYFPRLLRKMLRHPSVMLADSLIDLLIPPLSVVVLLTVLGSAAAAGVPFVPAGYFVLPLFAFGLAVVTGLTQLHAPGKVWRFLLAAPVFMVWKLLLLAKVLLQPRETEWKRTPRDSKE